MRRIRGTYPHLTLPPHPSLPLTPAAAVSAQVMQGGRLIGVDFLIDTGADYTTLGPRSALQVLGPAYLSLDFADPDTSLEMSGVGGGVTRLLLRELPLAFFADDGSRVAVTLNLAIAEPSPPAPSDRGSWLLPSLLGRDILHHFDLLLSYHPPTVALIELATT